MNNEKEARELTAQEERDLDNAARLLVGLLTPPDDGEPEVIIPDDQAVA